MRASLLLVLLPVLAGCNDSKPNQTVAASSSSFDKRIQCAELASTGKWDNNPNGPFLDETYYSPALDTCIFVMRQSYPGDKDGELHNDVLIINALTRKQLWSNDPKAGETEDQLDAKLDQELSKLQIAK